MSGKGLIGVHLSNRGLIQADIRNSNLTGTNFSGTNLQKAQISQWFDKALIEVVIVRGISIWQADVLSSDVRGFDLTYANFHECYFQNSNLIISDAMEAGFWTSNLASANFSNADLTTDNLISSEGISSIIWVSTIYPDETSSSAYDPPTRENYLDPTGPFPYSVQQS